MDAGGSNIAGHYDTMELLLQDRMEASGLKYPEDLKKVYSLIPLKDLERQIYIENVKLAAQEVIKRAYEKLGESKD